VVLTLLFLYHGLYIIITELCLLVVVDSGKAWLTDNWKLCTSLETTDDVVQLKYWAADVYVALAMVNYPYEANFLAPLPANPIKV